MLRILKRIFMIRGGIHLLLALPPTAEIANSQNLECVKELEVPRYNLSSRRSFTGGTVTAIVSIGRGGLVSQIDTGTADRNLAEEVRTYLTTAATYSETCEGKKVEITFTFKLEGEPEFTPPVFVRFRPPNHFIIISRPRKPIVN